jgi:hypothetical protein
MATQKNSRHFLQIFLRVDILLQRMFFYHLAATYLPTACLLIIAEITLYIDDSHFEVLPACHGH